jgi:hypothetical protein
MPQTNISFMETAPPRPGEQWREVWLKKFEQACLEKELKESTVTVKKGHNLRNNRCHLVASNVPYLV